MAALRILHGRVPRRPCIRGDRLPAELYGNVFVAEPSANLVSRIVVTDDGQTLRGPKGVRPAPSSSRRRTSVSGPFTSRRRLTARSTSSTCIAASSSTAATSPSICAIRSSRESSNSRRGLGRIYRVVHETDPSRTERPSLSSATAARARRDALASERLVARHGAAVAGRARRQVDRRCAARSWRPVRRSREPGCTRCGRWMVWTRSNPPAVIGGARRRVARRPRVGAASG